MKLKLTYSEFSALYRLLETVCRAIKPAGIEAQVLHGTLFRLYKRFYNKAIVRKVKYTISAEPDEACAFWMFFSKFELTGQDTFTINLVHTLLSSIHQKYST